MNKKYINSKHLTMEEAIKLANNLIKLFNVTDEDIMQESYLVAIESANLSNHAIYDKVRRNIIKSLSEKNDILYIEDHKEEILHSISEYDDFTDNVFYKVFTNELLSNSKLTCREERIIKLHDLLNFSFSEIGEIYGISGCRANQIYNRAIRKIRKYIMYII